MKKIILTTIFAAVLSGVCAPPIFGQCSDGSTFGQLGQLGKDGQKPSSASKASASTKPTGKTPLQTVSISSAAAKGKINAQIMPSAINCLKVTKTYWDDNNKALFVRVENVGVVAESKLGVLALKLFSQKLGVKYESGGSWGVGKLSNTMNNITIYTAYAGINPLQPKNGKAFQADNFALLYFDFKDFKGTSNELMSVFEYVSLKEGKEKLNISLEIITEDSKGK